MPFAVVALGLVALVVAGAFLTTSTGPGGQILGIAGVLFGGVVLVVGCIWWRRERRHFDIRNEYAIVIDLEAFRLVTPDRTQSCAWSAVGPFEVVETATHFRTKFGQHRIITYAVISDCGEMAFKIPLDDFATGLGGDNRQIAETMCDVLNDLRQKGLRWESGEAAQPFQVLSGLVVAPLRRAPSVRARTASVVTRQ